MLVCQITVYFLALVFEAVSEYHGLVFNSDPPVSACQVLGLQVCSNMSVRLLFRSVLSYTIATSHTVTVHHIEN